MIVNKYEIPLNAVTVDIEMPRFAHIISAGRDPAGPLCIWAIGSPINSVVKRRIAIVHDGQDVAAAKINIVHDRFIGTVVVGVVAYHLFDRGEEGRIIGL